jgi:hypothetical protein
MFDCNLNFVEEFHKGRASASHEGDTRITKKKKEGRFLQIGVPCNSGERSPRGLAAPAKGILKGRSDALSTSSGPGAQ